MFSWICLVTASLLSQTDELVLAGEMSPGDTIAVAIPGPIFEVRSPDLDLEVTVTTQDRSWELASWQGSRGTVYVALTNSEITEAALRLSTTNSRGPKGSFEVALLNYTDIGAFEAIRSLMGGLDSHYRWYRKKGDERAEARGMFEQSLAYWKSAQSRPMKASVAFELASLEYGMGLNKSAAENFLIALNNWEQGDDLLRSASAANMRGQSLARLGNNDLAIEYYDKCIQYRIRIGRRPSSASCLNNIALIEHKRGRFPFAIKRFKSAFEARGLGFLLDESMNDDTLVDQVAAVLPPRNAISLLNNLALSHRAMGNSDIEGSLRRKAGLLAKAANDPVRLAHVQLHTHQARFIQGEVDTALRGFLDVQEELDRSGSESFRGLVRLHLGNLYRIVGQAEDAHDYINAAITHLRAAEDPKLLGDALFAAGDLAVESDMPSATTLLEEATDIFDGLDFPAKSAKSRVALSRFYTHQDELEKAQMSLEKAQEHIEQLGSARDRAQLHMAFADVWQRHGLLDQALESVESAIRGLEKSGDTHLLIQCWLLAANVKRSAGDKSGALNSAYRATDLSDAAIQTTFSPELRAGLAASRRDAVAIIVESLVAKGEVAQAWAYYDRSRLVTAGLWHLKPVEGQSEVLRKIGRKESLRAQYVGLAGHEDSVQALDREIRALYRQLPAGRSGHGVDSDSSRFQATIPELPERTALVSYFFTEEKGWVFWILNDQVFVRDTEAGTYFSEEVQRLRLAIADRSKRFDDQSFLTLSKNLLQGLPIQDLDQIIVVPDEDLHALPFAVLPNPSGDGQMVDLVDFVYSLRASDVKIPYALEGKQSLLVLADPVYQANDPRLKSSSRRKLDPVVAGLTRSNSLLRLWASAVEARAIGEVAGDNAFELRTGFAANRDFLLSPETLNSSILHIAAHGLLNERFAGLSALALSQYDALGESSEGVVFSAEIAGQQFEKKLVVLSACDTGLGKHLAGEGLFGLGRAFLEAGTESVLATLWPVDDTVTSRLMRDFYSNLLAQRQNPAISLLKAQRTVRSEKQTSHPYYWAGFFIQTGYRS